MHRDSSAWLQSPFHWRTGRLPHSYTTDSFTECHICTSLSSYPCHTALKPVVSVSKQPCCHAEPSPVCLKDLIVLKVSPIFVSRKADTSKILLFYRRKSFRSGPWVLHLVCMPLSTADYYKEHLLRGQQQCQLA